MRTPGDRPRARTLLLAFVGVALWSMLTMGAALRASAPTTGDVRAAVAERLGVRPALLERVGGRVLDDLATEIQRDISERQRGTVQRNVLLAAGTNVLVAGGVAVSLRRRSEGAAPG